MPRYTGPLVNLGCLAFLLSCSKAAAGNPDRSTLVTLDHSSLHPVPLTGQLVLKSRSIGKAGPIVVNGKYLWINDRSGDPFVHVVDLTSSTLVRSFGRLGDGPNEYQFPLHWSTRAGDTAAAWLFDQPLHRITRLRGDSAVSSPEIISAPKPFAGTIRMAWLGRDRILTVDFMAVDRIVLSDSEGRRLSVVRGNLLGPSAVPYNVRAELSSAVSVCSPPDGSAFAFLYGRAGRIQVYDAQQLVERDAAVPFPSDGFFVKGKSGTWNTPAPRYYYEGCAASARALYALFSGSLATASEDPRTVEARFVHVFDWRGARLGVLALDRAVSAIAQAGDSLLYAIGSSDAAIYAYRIPGSATRSGDAH